MKRQFLLAFLASPAMADTPLVTAAMATPLGDGWTISVTLSHPDTGWDHYADGWDVLAGDGQSLGLRPLLHPHEQEQPFTRTLQVDGPIPNGAVVRARCNRDGWGAATFVLDVKP